jgi:hypothetical protein
MVVLLMDGNYDVSVQKPASHMIDIRIFINIGTGFTAGGSHMPTFIFPKYGKYANKTRN